MTTAKHSAKSPDKVDPRGVLYHFFFLALSIYVLAVLVAEAFFVSAPETRRVLQFIDLSICLLFLFDFRNERLIRPQQA